MFTVRNVCRAGVLSLRKPSDGLLINKGLDGDGDAAAEMGPDPTCWNALHDDPKVVLDSFANEYGRMRTKNERLLSGDPSTFLRTPMSTPFQTREVRNLPRMCPKP